MPDSDLPQQMREEWDEFFAAATEVVRGLEDELKRLPPGDRHDRAAKFRIPGVSISRLF